MLYFRLQTRLWREDTAIAELTQGVIARKRPGSPQATVFSRLWRPLRRGGDEARGSPQTAGVFQRAHSIV